MTPLDDTTANLWGGRIVRLAALAGVFLFGFFLVGWVGTQAWGLSLAAICFDLVVASALLIPASAIPWLDLLIDRRWRDFFLRVGITFLIAFTPGELFGRAQEYHLLRTYGTHPSENLHFSRWAPFSDHEIQYYTNSGWTGWD